MPSAVEITVNTYVRVPSERDAATRAKMLESCFAVDGRLVARSREVRGRAAVAEMVTKFLADPRLVGVRVVSAIDAQGMTFRFRSVVDFNDGTSAEFFDAGEIDNDGKISTILTFAGPLGDAK